MVSWKDFIRNQFIGKKLHFIADCVIPIDITGLVVDLEWHSGEIIFCVQLDSGKISKIGSNTTNLRFEKI